MGEIFELTSDGTQSTFASDLNAPNGLAFQPVPALSAANEGGTIQLTASMPSPYYSTIIEASSNLMNWAGIDTNTPPFTFTDSAAAQLPYRFYRAQLAQ
jgi:hypothetical protein